MPFGQKFDGEIIPWSFSLRLFAKGYFCVDVTGQHCRCFSTCHVHSCRERGKAGTNHRSSSAGTGQMPAEKSCPGICEKAPLWCSLAFASRAHVYVTLPWPQGCAQGDGVSGSARCPQIPQLNLGSGLRKDPWQWRWDALLFLFSRHPIHSVSLFGTISVPKEKAELLHVGTGSLPRVMCQIPFIFPAQRFSRGQKPRWEAGEVRCSSPCPCWCESLWWLPSASKYFKGPPLFSRISRDRGLEEGRDQPVHRGEGWLCSEPHSWKLTHTGSQVPAHIRLNKGQIGFLMKHSPLFSS